MDDLLNEFLTETNEAIAVLDVELVRLEQNPNDPGAQKTFLIAELAAVTAAFDTLNQATAQNGVNQATLEDTQDRQEKSLTFVRIFISDIEDVNVVEAISRLNLDQLALDASFQVFSRLTRLTLVDFL